MSDRREDSNLIGPESGTISYQALQTVTSPDDGYRRHQYDNTAFAHQESNEYAATTSSKLLAQEETKHLIETNQSRSDRSDCSATEKTPSSDELLFRLKYAHVLQSEDWLKEITDTNRLVGDVDFYLTILEKLNTFPLPIRQKNELSKAIRTRLEVGSVSNFSRQTRGEKARVSKRMSKHRPQFNYQPTIYTVWEKQIAKIAAYFGSNVASYFIFLRFMVLLNLFTGLLLFFFVGLPQIIPLEVYSEELKAGFFGYFSKTIFFYGAYSNSSLPFLSDDFRYERPLAYLITWAGVSMVTILAIVTNMYRNYKKSKLLDIGGSSPYTNLCLTTWDHSLTTTEGKDIFVQSLTTHCREMIREDICKKNQNKRERLHLWCVRGLVNIVTLIVMGASGYLIYFVADRSIKPDEDEPSAFKDFLTKYSLTCTVTGLKVLVPPFLNLLLSFESWHPRTEIKLQITRTAMFYTAKLAVYLVSIYTLSTECVNSSPQNSTLTTQVEISASYCCWENEVGEQLLQIIVLNLLLELAIPLVNIGVRVLLLKCCSSTIFGYIHFDVAENFLDLVYGQSLIWLGLYWCPFMCLVGVVIETVLFWFKYSLARSCYAPPTSFFKASRSRSFFNVILLISAFVSLVPLTYTIINVVPSQSCGPFRSVDRSYFVVTNRLGELPAWIQDIIRYISTAAVIVPLIIILILFIVFYKVKASTQKHAATKLLEHLHYERKVEKRRVLASAHIARGISQVSNMDQTYTGAKFD